MKFVKIRGLYRKYLLQRQSLLMMKDSSSTTRKQDSCLDFITRLLIVNVFDENVIMESFLADEFEKLPYLWNPKHPHFAKRLKKIGSQQIAIRMCERRPALEAFLAPAICSESFVKIGPAVSEISRNKQIDRKTDR
ncbi:hypothetical protein TNCV_4050411 [Trichonephila clavipes]|nr:hypothetical protein TNCV_4050411 [Trichonephila clavipes]